MTIFKLIFRVDNTRVEEKIDAGDIQEAYNMAIDLGIKRTSEAQTWTLIAVESK